MIIRTAHILLKIVHMNQQAQFGSILFALFSLENIITVIVVKIKDNNIKKIIVIAAIFCGIPVTSPLSGLSCAVCIDVSEFIWSEFLCMKRTRILIHWSPRQTKAITTSTLTLILYLWHD